MMEERTERMAHKMSDDSYRLFEIPVPGGVVKGFSFGGGSRDIVILPGMSFTPIWPDAAAVVPMYQGPGEGFRFWLFDRREPLQKGDTVETMAADTAAAMKELGIGKADFIGVSQGGMMCLALALDFPELVRSIVLCASASRTNEISRATFAEWMELCRQGDPYVLSNRVYATLYPDRIMKERAAGVEWLTRSYGREICGHYALQTEACLAFDRYADLKKITCPVFVLGGECDRVLGAEASREIAEALGCYCHIYPGADHAIQDDGSDCIPRMIDLIRTVDA